jgi:DNA-binding NtrC family response regulator
MNIALIDDSKRQYDKYKTRLELKGINLIFMEYIQEYDKIIQWLLDNEIKFVLIDYKLDDKYEFEGSNLMHYIDNAIPDLQCALFTSNIPDDDLVMNCQMIDKNVFNTRGEKFDKFIDRVKQAVTVFENRQKISLKEYNELLEKKKKTELNVSEIERMEELYKRLYSYGLVEYMPKEFFETNIEEKIDELIKVVEKYIDKK